MTHCTLTRLRTLSSPSPVPARSAPVDARTRSARWSAWPYAGSKPVGIDSGARASARPRGGLERELERVGRPRIDARGVQQRSASASWSSALAQRSQPGGASYARANVSNEVRSQPHMCRRDHESADALQTDAVASTFGEELAKGVVEPVGAPWRAGRRVPPTLGLLERAPRCGSRVVGASREGLAEALAQDRAGATHHPHRPLPRAPSPTRSASGAPIGR
jgi:hypothetical protein